MIVDASAMLAILLGEPEADRFREAILAQAAPEMSVANWLEVAMRVDRLNRSDVSQAFDALMIALGISLKPVTIEQAALARLAFARFGRGRHPAALNFGDCFAYALAQDRGAALLFKGDDFLETDIAAAI